MAKNTKYTRPPVIMSDEALEKLNTKRLLGVQRSLRHYIQSFRNTVGCTENGTNLLSHKENQKQVEAPIKAFETYMVKIKEILATRENVTKK